MHPLFKSKKADMDIFSSLVTSAQIFVDDEKLKISSDDCLHATRTKPYNTIIISPKYIHVIQAQLDQAVQWTF